MTSVTLFDRRAILIRNIDETIDHSLYVLKDYEYIFQKPHDAHVFINAQINILIDLFLVSREYDLSLVE